MNKYEKILELFILKDKDSNHTEWQKAPFLINDLKNAYATDGNIMVSVPKELIIWQKIKIAPKENLKYEKVFDYFNPILSKKALGLNINKKITLDVLEHSYALCPMIDEKKPKKCVVLCEECKGTGEVDYYYNYESDDFFKIKGICPICNGTKKGYKTLEVSTGKKIKDLKNNYIKVDVVYLSIYQVKLLIDVLNILSIDYIQCIYMDKNYLLFSINDENIKIVCASSFGIYEYQYDIQRILNEEKPLQLIDNVK